MDLAVEIAVEHKATLGEGPVWDERESALWWLDITGRQIHRFDPATGEDAVRDVPRPVGTLVPRASGGLVLATPLGFEAYDPATGSLELLAAVEADDEGTRMNDGKCDRRGRLWAGTMAFDFADGAGSFYRMDADRSVEKVLGGVTISNGLAWSDDDSVLYWIDSMTHKVEAFDFDADAGAISNRRTVVDIPEEDGIPDGMTIDTEGYLWVALYNGACVRRYSSDGVLDAVVEMPVRQVTCCAFGGPDLSDLYITTARQDFTDEDDRAHPTAGSLFVCRPGVKGHPADAYAG